MVSQKLLPYPGGIYGRLFLVFLHVKHEIFTPTYIPYSHPPIFLRNPARTKQKPKK